MSLNLDYQIDEIRHRAEFVSRWSAGYILRQGVNALTGGGAMSLGLGKAAGITGYTFGAVGLGLGVGIRGYLNYKEKEHHKHQLTHFYRDEIAAKLGKARSQVTSLDLIEVAKHNPSLQEELDQNTKQMQLKTFASAMGAIASFALTVVAVGALTGLAAPLATPLLMMAAGVVGLTTHLVTEAFVEKVGAKQMDLDKPSAVDRIIALDRGRRHRHELTQEQVMGVYAAASPDLQESIIHKYGKPFDKLSLINQSELVVQYGKPLKLEAVTNAINENRLNVRELAFLAHGDLSGAYPEPTMHQRINESLAKLKENVTAGRTAAAKRWDGFTSRLINPLKEKSWVADLGLTPPAEAQTLSWEARTKGAGKAISPTTPSRLH
jgi:hypothetical protein